MDWRLFADVAERAGTRRVTVDLPADATVDDALEALFDAHPELRDRVMTDGQVADHLTILKNGDPVDADPRSTHVDSTDELALFPPVSGG